MSRVDGYAATKLLAEERPDLLPWLRLIFDRGAGELDDVPPDVLAELVRRGILERRSDAS